MYLVFFTGISPQGSGSLAPVALVFLLQASIGCGMIYVVTQALIAIVDLLSRIEQNTRPQ
jgi:hypothetical protein